MEIRIATSTDVPELTRLRIAAVAEANPSATISATLWDATRRFFEGRLGGFICWLAADERRLRATASIIPFERLPSLSNPSGREGYVTNVYTEPEHRRNGLATNLVRAAVADARSVGMRRLWLYSTEGGRHLYEGAGFVMKLRQEVEMQLPLNP